MYNPAFGTVDALDLSRIEARRVYRSRQRAARKEATRHVSRAMRNPQWEV